MVTVLKTTHPRNRGLGCTSRYGKTSTKTALLPGYLTVKHTWQPVCHETRKLFGFRMFAAAFRYPLSLLSQNTALMNNVCWSVTSILSCLNLQLSVQTSVSPSAYERKTEVEHVFMIFPKPFGNIESSVFARLRKVSDFFSKLSLKVGTQFSTQ